MPEWHLQFDESVNVEGIAILNRWCVNSLDSSSCYCRLSNATVELYDESGNVVAARSLNDTCGRPLLVESFATSTSLSADKVRIEATTGDHLHMLEFQIHSTSGSNVAPQGTASQSSTWGNLAAAKAIDSSNSTFSHTADMNAWWEVQLNKAEGVEKLVILNRHCQGVADSLDCLCRLSEARITLYNNNVSLATRQLGNTCGELVVSESFSSQLFTIY
jgi:hypothetical protein